jgi:hypothetical protein
MAKCSFGHLFYKPLPTQQKTSLLGLPGVCNLAVHVPLDNHLASCIVRIALPLIRIAALCGPALNSKSITDM